MGQRYTIDQRRAELTLHDDEYDGAPPHAGVDLTGRWVVVKRVPRSPAN